MNVCGVSPLTVQIRNLDAVDVAATNLSCDTLNINGEPVGDVLSNASATPGSTTFTGDLTITGSLKSSAPPLPVDSLAIVDTGKLTFSGSTLQQKINLYNALYGIGVSTNQLNLVGGTSASLVYYTGGTNNDGTERFKVQSNGDVTVTGSLKSSSPYLNVNSLALTDTSTLAFSGNALQQKINLYTGTYGIGVSGSQLNLIGGTSASLVYYTGGTNNDGTERFRVQSNGNVQISGTSLLLGGSTVPVTHTTVVNVASGGTLPQTLTSTLTTPQEIVFTVAKLIPSAASGNFFIQAVSSGGTVYSTYKGYTTNNTYVSGSQGFDHSSGKILLGTFSYPSNSEWCGEVVFRKGLTNVWVYTGTLMGVGTGNLGVAISVGGSFTAASGVSKIQLDNTGGGNWGGQLLLSSMS